MEHDQQTSSPSGSFRRRHSVRTDFVQKYGDLQQVVGKGAFGTVRLSVKKNWETGEEHVYAIKEFKFTHGESQKQYMRRLTSEFCIASSLRHVNVIHTMDLLQLQGDTYSEVMEYCSGGDMHSLIASANSLGESESNCFFAQLVNGVAFLHAMGVVHRDLKPENLLLSADGCLKIADFGNSEVFRMPWEKKVRSSASIRGSGPFIAPEEFTNKTFDARKVDMWSCGIIYMCMRLGRYTWHEASDGDPIWDGYLYKRARYLEMKEEKGQEDQVPSHINLTSLEQASHTTLGLPTYIADVLENLLEPDTRKRWQANKVLDSEWFKQIDNCHPSERQPDQILDESDFEIGTTKATRLGQQQPSQRVGSKVVPLDSSVTGCKIVKEVRDRRATSSGEPGESVVARAS
ncbi:serine/threonine-protein kinase HAL4/sat4 [Gryganskiella cystojenkinii]|nr:serine/threonine-protein kinase HAL4/sat4 [Gryganskiella cystojenkinii]